MRRIAQILVTLILLSVNVAMAKQEGSDPRPLWRSAEGAAVLPSLAVSSLPIGGLARSIFVGWIVLYGAFQKKLLPKAMSRRAAKLFFWPMLPVTYLHRRNALWTRVDDSVLVGVAPVAFSVTPANLKRMGVKGVVNLCDEFMGPTRSYAQLQMQELRLPVVDHFEPSVADLQKAVDFIERVTKDGSAVYVHCKAGHGRSAAVVFAWLTIKHPEKTPKEIQALLSSKRKVRKKTPHAEKYTPFS
uniref:Tyrosine specific protein phosphatases domain-containing protein n=1 Tax=Florenciella parvula TaxID=236787 RepID=A0A7S2CPR4_9STRA|mmetsp:Transcript_3142/g.6751  ORF Transcript_3142/g.6751 Transcript_3142/m.6751 type:complete len:244 (+) Transcript_3142:239-970(+)